MEFKCIGSGSTGNCFLIKTGDNSLLLDAGVSIDRIVQQVNLNDIDLCLITHEHKDHCASREKLYFRGVFIEDGKTIQGFNKIVKNVEKTFNLDLFAFPVEHGDTKCCGYIILNEKNGECILYITDFTNCIYNLSKFKFTSVIIECNYVSHLVDDANDFIRTKENINRHLSLDGCQMFLDTLDLSRCKEIYLMHLSNGYSNPIEIGSTIYSRYRIRTGVCRANGGVDYYG